MRIARKLSQHRRDFWADYECQYCGHVEGDKPGYDDANFHKNVIPKMICPKCGKSVVSERDTSYQAEPTVYAEGVQI